MVALRIQIWIIGTVERAVPHNKIKAKENIMGKYRLENKQNAPLLAVGTFGVHLLDNPAGSFSFTGTVPAALSGCNFETYEQGEAVFIEWLKAQSADFQREHVGNLRNDVFTKFMAA